MIRRICDVVIPFRTRSEPNTRDGWRRKARRVKEQRSTTAVITRVTLRRDRSRIRAVREARRIDVLLSRTGPRPLDDDNLAGALKAVRDGVADALGIDDGDPRLKWNYEQATFAEYGVCIRIDVVEEDNHG